MYCKLILIGNLGDSPELKFLSDGKPVCNFRMATNRKWKDGEEVTWWRVAVFGPQAEPCNQYLSKGSRVLVEAESVKANAYLDKSGEAAASLEVIARSVQFLSGKAQDTEQVPF